MSEWAANVQVKYMIYLYDDEYPFRSFKNYCCYCYSRTTGLYGKGASQVTCGGAVGEYVSVGLAHARQCWRAMNIELYML